MAKHVKESMPESQMHGKQHGRQQPTDREEFNNRFFQMWQAYVDEPGISKEEKARRQKELETEQENLGKMSQDELLKEEKSHEGTQVKEPETPNEQDHETPLSHEDIVAGINRSRKPKAVEKSDSDSAYEMLHNIKGSVHISKKILDKMESQKNHLSEVISKHGEPQINEQSFPNLETLPAEQRRWFAQYQESADKLKSSMKSKNYTILEGIGLKDDIPAALC
jgi:hypothetical protein